MLLIHVKNSSATVSLQRDTVFISLGFPFSFNCESKCTVIRFQQHNLFLIWIKTPKNWTGGWITNHQTPGQKERGKKRRLLDSRSGKKWVPLLSLCLKTVSKEGLLQYLTLNPPGVRLQQCKLAVPSLPAVLPPYQQHTQPFGPILLWPCSSQLFDTAKSILRQDGALRCATVTTAPRFVWQKDNIYIINHLV